MTTKHTKDSTHETSKPESETTNAHATTKGKTMTLKTKKSAATPPPSNVGLLSIVREMTAYLDQAEAQLGPEPPATTAAEKRRRSKPRKGSERVFSLLAPIVRQHGLESVALNADAMVARNATAEALVPLQARLVKMTKRVNDEVFDAQTDAWSMGLQFYSLLQRRAKGDGSLAQNLEPIAKVFSYRHRSVTEEKPTKTQTRVKAQLKKVAALAEKHGVAMPGAAAQGAAGTPVAGAPVAGTPEVATPVVAATAVPVAAVAAPATPVAAEEAAAPAQVNGSPAQVAVGAGAAGVNGAAAGANGAPLGH